MNTLLRRGLAAAAVTALGAGLVSAPAAQADVSRTPQTVNAAEWLSSQVIDGRLYNEQFDFVDWGLTLDTLLALDTVGGYRAKVADIADALETSVGEYIGTGDEQYAGSIAKTLVAVQAAADDTDVDPGSYGGVDLVSATEARIDGTGRLADQSTFGNFANVFGQSFAVEGLTAAGSDEADEATAFLLQQQCADGGFRLDFTEDDATCTGDESEVDATAIAVDALQSQQADGTVSAALGRARDYLLSGAVRGEDGSYGGGPSTEAPNTNSTAAATAALEQLGEAEPAEESAAWVADRQVTAYSACGTELDGEFGGVAYDDAAIAAAEDDGIEVETEDQWRRATAPAIVALRSYVDPAPRPATTLTVVPAAVTDGLATPGMPMTTTVSGLAPFERYCTYTLEGTAAKAGRAKEDGTAVIAAKAPASVGLQPVTVYGERDARQGAGKVRVLPPVKKLPVTLSATKVKRGGSVVVTATGLAPLEKARVSYGGRIVVTGKATPTGTFRYTLAVGTATGTKSVSVLGLNATRKGTRTFTVVR